MQCEQAPRRLPKKYQDTAMPGIAPNTPWDIIDTMLKRNTRNQDDRLHGVKAHETIVLFKNIKKNDAADQRNASMAAATFEANRSIRDFAVVPGSDLAEAELEWALVWHDLHTQTESVLSSNFFCAVLFASLPIDDPYHSFPPPDQWLGTSFCARLHPDRGNCCAGISHSYSQCVSMYTSISERAKATKDMSNLRQIGIATQII